MRAKALTAEHPAVRKILKARGSPKAHANCKRKPYKKIKVPEFSMTGELIAYTSPDCTFAVTRERFTAAKTSIRIGIYDFTAEYIREELIDAMQRGVTIEVMLDLEGKAEQSIFDNLSNLGASMVRAPSCAYLAAPYFSVVHEKVIIIDDRWCLVQSGNYSTASVPVNEPDKGWPKFKTGNRDTGVAMDSKALSAFFSKRLAGDRKLVIDAKLAPKAIAALKALPKDNTLIVPKPPKRPSELFKAKSFQVSGLKVQPILTPDNYLTDVPAVLERATKTVHIEQQYIWSNQPKVQELIQALVRAKKKSPSLEIKIVLGKAFSADDVKKFDAAIARLGQDLGLKRMTDVRFINQAMFTHCHNKMILIDGKIAITSSQNWSDTAVDTNREAGVILYDSAICKYFEAIFAHDWKTGVAQPLEKKGKFFEPKSFAAGNLMRLDLGDVAFV